jgi:cytochrome c oxidase cbb3-type subunit III
MNGLSLWEPVLAALLVLAGCSFRGRPGPDPEVPRPDSVLNPEALFRENCAGCHGADGRNGAAMSLSDPIYLAIVDDDTLRNTISKGRKGTAMSAFAQSEGGMLTDAQIDAIIHGMRARWGRPNVLSRVTIPPYSATSPGNPQAGQAVYNTFCLSCHGTGNQGGPKAGSVTNGAYLSLISDQGLRTFVIFGRPDFNAPDWRTDLPGRPMSDQEISDVVAWLAAQRPEPVVGTTPASTRNSTSAGGAP